MRNGKHTFISLQKLCCVYIRQVRFSSRLCKVGFRRSSHRKCSVKNVFLETSQNSQGPASLFNKFEGLRLATLLKKRLWQKSFPVNFAKFLRTTFFTEHLRVTASDSSSNRRNPGKGRTKISL